MKSETPAQRATEPLRALLTQSWIPRASSVGLRLRVEVSRRAELIDLKGRNARAWTEQLREGAA